MTTATATSELSDSEYEIADRIYALLESDVTRSWTPSSAARKVHTDTTTAAAVLRWMREHRMVAADGNGAWTRYSARS